MAELKRSRWGPAAWTFLHTSAAAIEDPDAFSRLLRTLPATLPCPECRQHSAAHLAANPPELAVKDAESASRYVFAFHNAVNARLNKPAAGPQILQAYYNVVLPEMQRPHQYQRVLQYRRF